MTTSRRNFIKKLGIIGLAGINLPDILSVTNLMPSTGKDDKGGKNLTFLFQGDSITDGNRTSNNDWNHVMGHGFACLIASRLWYDYPDKGLMFYNRGISGNRVKDIDSRWQKDALDLKPGVVSILIGINDIMAIVKNEDPEPIEKFEETYIHIIERTKEALPNTKIVLCEPFIMPLGRVDERTEIWQIEIKKQQLLVRKLAATYNAIFVELQEPFNNALKKAPANYWIWDGIHPMPAGHELIARFWIKEVRKTFTFIKA